MATICSVMVVPSATADSVPQILMDFGGVWRDMSPTLTLQASLKVSEIKQRIDQDLSELTQQVEQGGQFTADSVPLVDIGTDYYGWIVPSQVRELLKRAADSAVGNDTPILCVHMHTQSEWIPWELFHDGTDFLGLRFQIARLPIVAHALEANGNQTRQVQDVYNLVGKNVLEPNEFAVWEKTFEGLIPAANEHRFPPIGGGDDTYPTIQQLKPSLEADIFHVTCHGIRVKESDKESYYWTLDHTANITWTYHITSKIIEKMILNRRPLVFGNACGSNIAGANAALTGLIPSGFGPTFFGRGALNFIGALAPISTKMGLKFAHQFYRRLLGEGGQPGLPIGQALCATKQHYRNTCTDPTYLFYCLYGPHETTFRV